MAAFLAMMGGQVVSTIAGTISAAKKASDARKAAKANAKGQIGVLTSDTQAQIEKLNADLQSQRASIQVGAEATVQSELYEAGIHDQNAAFSRIMAKDALGRGDYETFFQYRDAAMARGTVRAQIAGTGVDVNRGSAVDLQRDIMLGADLDALAIRQNAQREAYGLEIEAWDEGQQAAVNRQTAASTRRVAATNIAGLTKVRDVTRVGLRSVKAANIKAIEENLDAGMGFSPFEAGLSTALGGGADFAEKWYMSAPKGYGGRAGT